MISILKAVPKFLALRAGDIILVLFMAQLVIVALRYVFAVGWPWQLDLLTYCFFLASLLPGVAVVLGNLSVRVDVLYDGWSKVTRHRVDRAALLLLLFPAMAYATKASWASTVSSWKLLESSPTIGGLPGYFILKTILTLFFASLALTALLLGLRKAPYGGGDA